MPRFRRRRARRVRRRRRRPRRRMRRTIRLDPERRHTESVLSLVPDINPLFVVLNAIPQGVNTSERIGNQAMFTSIQTRMNFIKNPGLPAGESVTLRVMFLIDKAPNNAALATNGSDILEFPQVPIESPRALKNVRRLKILFDRRVVLTPATPSKVMSWFRNLRLLTRWDDPNGGVTDMTRGALYLVLWSDRPTLADAPTVQLVTRTRWVG